MLRTPTPPPPPRACVVTNVFIEIILLFRRMKDILKTKEAQVLKIDHDEAEDVEDSEDDYDDLDFPNETIDYRPGSQQRHSADLRLKAANKTDSSDISPRNSDVKKKRPPVVRASGGGSSNMNKKLITSAPSESAKEEVLHNFGTEDTLRKLNTEDYDRDELSPASQGYYDKAISHHSGYARPMSREGSMGDSWSDMDISTSERPHSRGQGEGLAPLRAPKQTTAQLISTMRPRSNVDRPPSPSRATKLR